ncbi:MAG: hypothetical protein H6Q41_5573, partial [Deltaproteobacteria bacterium]|nr:hypothetical protein [Deltaproteobacteria bacterium]
IHTFYGKKEKSDFFNYRNHGVFFTML